MEPPWLKPFIDHLTESGNVSGSARAVGVHTAALYARRRNDGDFAAAWDQAMEDATDTLEAEARRRAVQGVQEPVVYQGQLTPVWETDAAGRPLLEAFGSTGPDGQPVTEHRPVQKLDTNGRPVWLTVTKYSDSLLALLLKGRRKHVFADRTELTGAGGGAVQISDTERTARLSALLALARQRKEGDFSDLA